VLVRLSGTPERITDWVAKRGGEMNDGTARFSVAHPVEIAPLIEDSSRAGLEVLDVSLRKPNLESVFLNLTGRELRD
jgi:ABC-2 type transport system ATP-binding protein